MLSKKVINKMENQLDVVINQFPGFYKKFILPKIDYSFYLNPDLILPEILRVKTRNINEKY
jgi:hypothetical protein